MPHVGPDLQKRPETLRSLRNLKMARSAHAYVRGNTLKFYEWLDALAPSTLPEGPAIWICGDCHVGNLGPVANLKGKVSIQIRDFDQTVIGNPAHDLIRLGLSLAMAARGSDLPGVTTARIMEHLIEGYEAAFTESKLVRKPDRPKVIHVKLKEAVRRSWRHLAQERTQGQSAAIPLGSKFWSLATVEKTAVKTLFDKKEVRSLTSYLKRRWVDADVALLDAAYWVKGCSSLGLLRLAILLDIDKKASAGRDLCLIDIKEAVKSSAPRYRHESMPRDNAERIVTGARALSPYLGKRMIAERLLERSVFIRELLPQDIKLDLDRLTADEATEAARYLANVVGIAHARQMDDATRKLWLTELGRYRSETHDTPSWLWKSVVDLVAFHEKGYLEHCRRFALNPLDEVD